MCLTVHCHHTFSHCYHTSNRYTLIDTHTVHTNTLVDIISPSQYHIYSLHPGLTCLKRRNVCVRTALGLSKDGSYPSRLPDSVCYSVCVSETLPAKLSTDWGTKLTLASMCVSEMAEVRLRSEGCCGNVLILKPFTSPNISKYSLVFYSSSIFSISSFLFVCSLFSTFFPPLTLLCNTPLMYFAYAVVHGCVTNLTAVSTWTHLPDACFAAHL